MPVHIEERGGRYCVVEPSGEVVSSGCYDDEGDALARLRAINANKEHLINLETNQTDTVSTSMSDSTTHISQDTSWWGDDMAEEEVEIKEVDDRKFDFIEIGPMSFAELDELREQQKRDMGIKTLVSDFMALVGNVMNFPSEDGRSKDLKRLVKEMEERLPEDDEEVPFEDEETEDKGDTPDSSEKSYDTEMENRGRLFTIWKEEATGKYRWLGVFSNKFRDDDSPAEILAEEAHLRFVKRVEEGELDHPDLYVWHIPAPIGKADLLVYDNAGFPIATGLVEEDYAIALMNTSEDLAMSHGMPAKSIRRDESDPTVITDYVSTELSVLPKWAAANKLTDFHVMSDEEEAKMAIIPEEKRQQVAKLLGDDLTERLEASLAQRSDKALAEGIEFKEEDQPAEETAENTTETTEEKTETAVEDVEEEAAAEVVAEAEDVAEESVEESDAGAADEQDSANEEPTLQKGEIVEALAFVMEAMTAQNEQLRKSIEKISDRLDALEGGVDDLQKSAEDQLAELASGTPEASMTAMLTSRLARAGTVIGNPATRVDENSTLAKEGPEETPEDGGEEGQAGLFFNSWQR